MSDILIPDYMNNAYLDLPGNTGIGHLVCWYMYFILTLLPLRLPIMWDSGCICFHGVILGYTFVSKWTIYILGHYYMCRVYHRHRS